MDKQLLYNDVSTFTIVHYGRNLIMFQIDLWHDTFIYGNHALMKEIHMKIIENNLQVNFL